MGNEAACTSENYKMQRVTRSSICTSPIILCAGRVVQCARSEQLSAVSTFERVHGIDISHDDRSHPHLKVSNSETGSKVAHVLRRSCETQLSISSGITISHVSSSICLRQLREDARADQLFSNMRGRNFVQVKTLLGVPNCNLHRFRLP